MKDVFKRQHILFALVGVAIVLLEKLTGFAHEARFANGSDVGPAVVLTIASACVAGGIAWYVSSKTPKPEHYNYYAAFWGAISVVIMYLIF